MASTTLASRLAQYAYSPTKKEPGASPRRPQRTPPAHGRPLSSPSLSPEPEHGAVHHSPARSSPLSPVPVSTPPRRTRTRRAAIQKGEIETIETRDETLPRAASPSPGLRRSARRTQPTQSIVIDDSDGASDASDYAPDPGPSNRSPYFPKRRTPNGRTANTAVDDDTPTDDANGSPTTPSKRTTRKRRTDGSLEDFGWKKPRRFASPSKYAHLAALPDALRLGLDIVFVGINPGTRSSKTGHFFAHPTNKFWRAMHGSGLTSRLLTPEEDVTLPDVYNFGMTNLVPRTTAEAAELSGHEKRVAVGPLANKLAVHRPRIVCFIGKNIWDVFASVARRSVPKSLAPVATVVKAEPDAGVAAPRVVSYTLDAGMVKREEGPEVPIDSLEGDDVLVKIEPGEEPILLLPRPASATPPPTNPDTTAGKSKSKTKAKPPPFTYDAPQPLRLAHGGGHTYFWALPNTSGLERTPLDEQIRLFGTLRTFLARLQRGEQVGSDGFVDVTAMGIARVLTEMRQKECREDCPGIHA